MTTGKLVFFFFYGDICYLMLYHRITMNCRNPKKVQIQTAIDVLDLGLYGHCKLQLPRSLDIYLGAYKIENIELVIREKHLIPIAEKKIMLIKFFFL